MGTIDGCFCGCLLHGFSFRVDLLFDWLPTKARKSSRGGGDEIDFIIFSVALVRKLTHLIWPKFDKTFRERLWDGLLLHYTLDLIYG